MIPIRTVLAGTGGYGAHYVADLLARSEGSDSLLIAGFVDPAHTGGDDLGKTAGIPLYDSLEAFFAADRADLAILATPIALHADQTILALREGAHVLCEKPMCVDLEQAAQMRLARDRAGKMVSIGYQWCHAPAIRQARKDIQAGRYGTPVRLVTRVYWPRSTKYFARNDWAGKKWTRDGRIIDDNVLSNATAHYLMNMLFMLGDGEAGAVHPRSIEAVLMRAYPIETYDTAMVRMAVDNRDGTSAQLLIGVTHCCERTFGPASTFTFSRGSLSIENNRLTGQDASGSVDYGTIIENNGIDVKVSSILAAIREGVPLPCTIETAEAHTAVIEQLRTMSVTMIPAERLHLETRQDETYLVADGMSALLDRFLADDCLPDDPVGELAAAAHAAN